MFISYENSEKRRFKRILSKSHVLQNERRRASAFLDFQDLVNRNDSSCE